jgi:transposase InsO family protein
MVDKLGGPGAFTELRTPAILSTLDTLSRRIGERFPDSGLSRIARDLRVFGDDVVTLTARLRRPIWPLRLASVAAAVGLLAAAIALVYRVSQLDAGVNRQLDFLQIAETAANEVILLALALTFLVRVEARYKRRLALASLHRLRSVAHVIDMHQLTKDPTSITAPSSATTESSPARSMTPYELTRYLDYCSELLALTSKMAALHAQGRDDTAVLAAVNDIESLTQGLSGKIWQKIMILDLS